VQSALLEQKVSPQSPRQGSISGIGLLPISVTQNQIRKKVKINTGHRLKTEFVAKGSCGFFWGAIPSKCALLHPPLLVDIQYVSPFTI